MRGAILAFVLFLGFSIEMMRPIFHISFGSSVRDSVTMDSKARDPRCLTLIGASPSGPSAFEDLLMLSSFSLLLVSFLTTC